MARHVRLLLFLFVVLLVAAWFVAREPGPGALSAIGTFVSSESCRRCHEPQFATWRGTAHADSLRDPSEDVIVGRFDGTPVDYHFYTATPYQKDGDWYVRIEGKDGRPSGEHKVAQVVGKSFEQTYLFMGENGEWRVVPLSWSLERQQWDHTHLILGDISGSAVAVEEDFDARTVVFNQGCGQCHATGYDVGFDQKTGKYKSTFLEGAVACESCHGPGSVHVQWHEAGRDTGTGSGYEWPAQLVHPRKDLDARRQLEACGRCHFLHEWRYAIAHDPRVGYEDIATTLNFDQRRGFHADGKIAGLNYHGTTQSQSACFLKGDMGCLDCHKLHGGKPWAMRWPENSDAQCTQCHTEIGADPAAHTHHKEARCVDCHMPRFLTGVLYFMRDHMITNPEPELTELHGVQNVPNACSVCHVEEGIAWVRKQRQELWGPTPPRLKRDVGLMMDLRRERVPAAPPEDMVATDRLIEVALDRESRSFFRNTAVVALTSRGTSAARETMIELLGDPSSALRSLALHAVSMDPYPEAGPALRPLLNDESRPNRVDAAEALALTGWRGRTPEYERAYRDALLSRERQQVYQRDRVKMAVLADATERPEEMLRLFDELLLFTDWDRSRGDKVLISRMAALYQRRGRLRIEAGKFEEALQDLTQAALLYGGKQSLWLWSDSAEALYALQRRQEALANWSYVPEGAPRGSLAQLLATYRIAHMRGPAAVERAALERAQEKEAGNPLMGEWVRRARRALQR